MFSFTRISSVDMSQEQHPSSPFSNEAIALFEEARHWIARHKLLVSMGTTALSLSLCWLGSMVVHEITNNYILDIHPSYFPNSIFIGLHSPCRPDERFPGGPPVMQDYGGVTITLSPWGAQVYRHDRKDLFCTLPDQW